MTSVTTRLSVEEMIRTATSLSDRIRSQAVNGTAADFTNRLPEWLEHAAQGDWQKLDTRLAWDGLDRETAQRILGCRPVSFDGTEPYWAPWLRSLFAFLDALPEGAQLPVCEDRSLPFADGLAPIVAFGLAELRTAAPWIAASRAEPSIIRDLFRRVSSTSEMALGDLFLEERTSCADLELLLAGPGTSPQTEYYSEFIYRLRNRGWIEVFSAYPVLGRLLAIALTFWAQDMARFLSHLKTDAGQLQARFFAHRETGEPLQIESSLSDPHRSGRSVKVVTFENGGRLVYKPKSLAIDAAWNNLLSWLRQQDERIDLRAANAWDRGSYGWVEFVEHSPCADQSAVHRFYRRAGMLSCIFYATQATDFHHENLIAAGDQLVAIDMETLFTHVPATRGPGMAGFKGMVTSVLRSGMMPEWERIGSAAFDLSGLGTYAGGQSGGRSLGWQHINTDHMFLSEVEGKLSQEKNMPFLATGPVDPGRYSAQVVEGFQLAYGILMEQREKLLAADGPVAAFRNCTVRVVQRPTHIYWRLLKRSLTPRMLRDGIARSLEFEGLSRHVLSSREEHGCREFFRSELDAIEQLDIPYFEASTGSSDLVVGEGIVSRGLLAGPSFDSVVEHISGFSVTDREKQAELIQGAFEARAMRFGEDGDEQVIFPARPEVPVAGVEQFLEEARRLARHIEARVLRGDLGTANFVGLESVREISRFRLQPLGASLYAGVAGVSVFYAGLYACTGDPAAREMALSTAASIRARYLADGVDPQFLRNLALGDGIGAGQGLGGVIYGLTAAARLTGDSALIEDALRLARHVTPEIIERDKTLDIIGGSAGELLGHLALYEASGDASALQTAILCGQHLVQKQKPLGQFAGWHTVAVRPLTGFSHGAAGIAYALLRLHDVYPDPAFLAAARAGIAFERSVYSPEHNNWPDLRSMNNESGVVYRSGWCHGAPGIGLARLASMDLFHDPEFRDEAQNAIQSIEDMGSYPIDTVCCGEFGMTETLLEADRVGGQAMIEAARRRASGVIASADQRRSAHQHGYLLGGCTTSGALSLGFFQGLAGVGYSLLRLANPQLLPSIALFE